MIEPFDLLYSRESASKINMFYKSWFSFSRRFNIIKDSDGTSAAAIRAAEHHGGIRGDTGWAGSPREAGLQSAFGVPADGSHRIARLRVLVSRGAHDKLRLRARRQIRP